MHHTCNYGKMGRICYSLHTGRRTKDVLNILVQNGFRDFHELQEVSFQSEAVGDLSLKTKPSW